MIESEAIMKRTAHLLALLVLFSTASAQYVEPWGATRALRMKEAAKLHDELSAMDKQVPYLSPAEQKWLDGELNSGNGKITDRYIRATDSQEYAVSTAKSGFALVLIPLNNLSSLKMACKDEVLMWTEVASRLPDGQLWQAVDHLVERNSLQEVGGGFRELVPGGQRHVTLSSYLECSGDSVPERRTQLSVSQSDAILQRA